MTTNEWEEIVCITPDNELMRKRGCGVMSYSTNGEEIFLIFGGFGPIPSTSHTRSQYVSLPSYPHFCYTNETTQIIYSLVRETQL